MEQFPSLEQLKAQMRVEIDVEDELIRLYGDAAMRSALTYIRRSAEELEALHREDGGEGLPPDFKVAVLLLAAHYYRVREAVTSISSLPVPYGLEYLLRPWRKLSRV